MIRLNEVKGAAKKPNEKIVARVRKAEEDFDAGMADDLNVAQALAAVFELVRDMNIAMESGKLSAADADVVRKAMLGFDEIFAVLKDDDAERLRAVGFASAPAGPSDEEINALVSKRVAAKKNRDFKESDRIRDELASHGIVLEDTREGVRWKRK
jgi:cysteinyl-tRNA synthetase